LYSLNDGRTSVTRVKFKPLFIRNLYLVYLGKKQNTEIEIIAFKRRNDNFTSQVNEISEITNQMVSAKNLNQFIELMLLHESVMEALLNRTSVMKLLFPDFQGAVKSLGAWGGDFVLAATPRDEQYVREYFKEKTLGVLFPFIDLALLRDKTQVLPVL